MHELHTNIRSLLIIMIFVKASEVEMAKKSTNRGTALYKAQYTHEWESFPLIPQKTLNSKICEWYLDIE